MYAYSYTKENEILPRRVALFAWTEGFWNQK